MEPGFQDHFSAVANQYADYRPRYPTALFDYLATLVEPGALVWDCACGTGQATVDLAARFTKVIATDASREQIASATRHRRVEYRVAPAERTGLEGSSVGLVTVAQALHWFDFEGFLAEVRRVLVPGGVLAAWAYGVNEIEGDRAINDLVQEFYWRTVGPYWPPERKFVEDGYRTIPFPFCAIAPPAFRMEARWTLNQLIGYFSTWSATNRFIKATGLNPLDGLKASIEELWTDPESARLVVWPLSLRVGRKE